MDNKLIPNSTQIPNLIMDLLNPRISPSEERCINYICRRTFGFQKEQDQISLSQFVDGIVTKEGKRLDYGAGVSLPSAVSALKNLVYAGAIFSIPDNRGNHFQINLEMDVEEVVKKLNYLKNLTKTTKNSLVIVVKKFKTQNKGNKGNKDNTMQPTLSIAPSEHYKFIKYWSELVQITRNIKPIVTAKDAKNLQRILKQEVITAPQLEKLALYFLGHHSFTKFSPSISTFLSSGILMGLINRMRNGPEFWKELDTIARRHKREAPKQEESLLKAVEALRQKMTWTKN